MSDYYSVEKTQFKETQALAQNLYHHLFTLATQVRGVSEEIQFGTAAVLIGLTLLINSLSISLRMYLRSRKKW